jgi:hypothetical protein
MDLWWVKLWRQRSGSKMCPERGISASRVPDSPELLPVSHLEDFRQTVDGRMRAMDEGKKVGAESIESEHARRLRQNAGG